MKDFIDKNMKWILIIFLIISLVITSHYIIKVYDSSDKMSYTFYKETVCKIDTCHKETKLCDVLPPTEVPEEEKDCKNNYDKYIEDLNNENIKLLSSSAITFFLFLIITITYIVNEKNKKRV
jgi:hypothetical protein